MHSQTAEAPAAFPRVGIRAGISKTTVFFAVSVASHAALAVGLGSAEAFTAQALPPQTSPSELIPFEPFEPEPEPEPEIEPEPEPEVEPEPEPEAEPEPEPEIAPSDPPPSESADAHEPTEAPQPETQPGPAAAPALLVTSQSGGPSVHVGDHPAPSTGRLPTAETSTENQVTGLPSVNRRSLIREWIRSVNRTIGPPTYTRTLQRALLEGTTLVALRVDPMGRVRNVRVRRSSGEPLLDEAALAHVADHNRVPAPIADIGWDRLWERQELTIPVSYRLQRRR